MNLKLITVIIGIITPFVLSGIGLIDGTDVNIFLCLLAGVIIIAKIINHIEKKDGE